MADAETPLTATERCALLTWASDCVCVQVQGEDKLVKAEMKAKGSVGWGIYWM